MVVTKRKASHNAGVLQEVADDQAGDEKGDDAAPLVAQGAVEQSEDGRDQDHERYGNMEWQRLIQQFDHRIDHDQNPENVDRNLSHDRTSVIVASRTGRRCRMRVSMSPAARWKAG